MILGRGRNLVLFLLTLVFILVTTKGEDLSLLRKDLEVKYNKNPNDLDSLFELMVLCGALGDLESLYNYYRILERKDPYYLKRGIVKNFKEENSDLLSLYKKAFSYYFLENVDEAIYYFEKIYLLRPKDDWVIAYLAYLYYLKNDLAKVENFINTGLQLNKDNEALHALLCAVYLKKGRYFSALKEYFITMDIVQRKGYKNIWEILKGLR